MAARYLGTNTGKVGHADLYTGAKCTRTVCRRLKGSERALAYFHVLALAKQFTITPSPSQPELQIHYGHHTAYSYYCPKIRKIIQRPRTPLRNVDSLQLALGRVPDIDRTTDQAYFTRRTHLNGRDTAYFAQWSLIADCLQLALAARALPLEVIPVSDIN
eukprot:5691857-Pleurochrysis_carterae.AAC.1